ncbi:hypothetical protein ACFYNO_11520 [Kitasatospora sp. NPDC006697]|uniref:hypothetical protein n=1 Tax=Kitasatospora sp. NPDC006697 TaxID=3364020 RepID=UPI00368C2116
MTAPHPGQGRTDPYPPAPPQPPTASYPYQAQTVQYPNQVPAGPKPLQSPSDPGDTELPQKLAGPFVRELHPQKRYTHRDHQLASVVFYRNGGHSVLTLQSRTHERRPWWFPWQVRRPAAVVQIAGGEHQSSFELRLPAKGDKDSFVTSVDVNWEVEKHLLAANKRLVDVGVMLRPRILDLLRTVSRGFDLADAERADWEIKKVQESEAWKEIGKEYGIRTRVFVRIDLGEAAQAIEKARNDEAVELARDQAREVRRRHNMQEALHVVRSGAADQYAFLLAQDPGRAHEVLGEVQRLAREHQQTAVDFVGKLVAEGVVQRHQLDESVQQLITHAMLGRLAPGAAWPEGGLPTMPTLLDPDRRPRPAVADQPGPEPVSFDKEAPGGVV